jgi:serine/threonine protein phosphatase PrpC
MAGDDRTSLRGAARVRYTRPDALDPGDTMHARGFGATHVGRRRENNEDAILVDDRLGIYAVCDGVGGHAAGEVASRLTIDTVEEVLAGYEDLLRGVARGTTDHARLGDALEDAVTEACARTYRLATDDPGRSGMACTITLLVVAGPKAAMAHVGDTRLYLYRDAVASQISTDHTLVADHVRRGVMTPAEARQSPMSNVLTRCVGSQASVEVDTLVLDVLPDDLFLLCSDGLSDYVDGVEEMTSLLSGEQGRDVPVALVDLANRRGGKDNVSVITVAIAASDEEQEELRALSAEVRGAVRALRRLDIFAELRFVDVLRILEIAEVRNHAGGDVVVEPGAPLEGMLVPVAGSYTVESEQHPVARLGPGEHIAATSLLVRRTSRMTVRARAISRALYVPGEAFKRPARTRPRLGVALFGKLAEQLGLELAQLGGSFSELREGKRWLRWALG